MKTIKGIEKTNSIPKENILEEYRVIKHFEYKIEIDLHNKINGIVFLKLQDRIINPTSEINLAFSGVQGLIISNEGNNIIQSSGFAIRNIQDSGWENIYWEIFDYENSRLFFYAMEVEILSVS